jgi:hypothetical protein
MGGGLCSACLFLPEGMVQQAGGHADLPVRNHLTQLQVDSAYPHLFKPRARYFRMNQNHQRLEEALIKEILPTCFFWLTSLKAKSPQRIVSQRSDPTSGRCSIAGLGYDHSPLGSGSFLLLEFRLGCGADSVVATLACPRRRPQVPRSRSSIRRTHGAAIGHRPSRP